MPGKQGKKSVASANATPAVDSSVDTPKVEDVTPKVEDPTAPASTAPVDGAASPAVDQPKKKEKRKTNLAINPARVRTHMDKMNLNLQIDDKIRELKAQLSALGETQTETPEYKTLEAKVSAYSKERVRFSNDASHVLATVCDMLITQQLRLVMAKTASDEAKMAQLSTLFSEGCEQLSLYPLFCTLPSYLAKHSAWLKAKSDKAVAEEVAVAVNTAVKDLQTLHNIKVAKGKKADKAPKSDTPKAPKEKKVKAKDDITSKTSFKTYVKHRYTQLKKDNNYETMSISSELKTFLSDEIVDFIKRVAPLIYHTTVSMKNKTINDISILKTIESLLIDGKQSVETLELKYETTTVPGKDGQPDVTTSQWVVVKTLEYKGSGFSELVSLINESKHDVVSDEEVVA